MIHNDIPSVETRGSGLSKFSSNDQRWPTEHYISCSMMHATVGRWIVCNVHGCTDEACMDMLQACLYAHGWLVSVPTCVKVVGIMHVWGLSACMGRLTQTLVCEINNQLIGLHHAYQLASVDKPWSMFEAVGHLVWSIHCLTGLLFLPTWMQHLMKTSGCGCRNQA